MVDGPEATRGASTNAQTLPAAHTTNVPTGQAALVAAVVRLGLGSVWSAQIGTETPRGFVLLVAGTPFEVPSPPPVPAGASLVVRVVDDGAVPAFEVLTEPENRLAVATARAIVAATLERAVGERLESATPARMDSLDPGPLRVDLALPGPEPRPRCRVTVGSRAAREPGGESTLAASVFIDLPDGAVEAYLRLASGRLQVDLVVETAVMHDRLAAGRATLEQALADVGFAASAVVTSLDPARLARTRASMDAPRPVPPAGGLLDIHV